MWELILTAVGTAVTVGTIVYFNGRRDGSVDARLTEIERRLTEIEHALRRLGFAFRGEARDN